MTMSPMPSASQSVTIHRREPHPLPILTRLAPLTVFIPEPPWLGYNHRSPAASVMTTSLRPSPSMS